jgi:serine/threonine-protein phosphatase 4 catalytic subunit
MHLCMCLSAATNGMWLQCRCGNVAAILELDEQLSPDYKIFEAAPQEARGVPPQNPAPDYFL